MEQRKNNKEERETSDKMKKNNNCEEERNARQEMQGQHLEKPVRAMQKCAKILLQMKFTTTEQSDHTCTIGLQNPEKNSTLGFPYALVKPTDKTHDTNDNVTTKTQSTTYTTHMNPNT